MKEQHTPFVFKSQLLGYTAYWATSQSPYHAPEGLTEVLAEFDQRLKLKPFDLIEATRSNLMKILKEKFLTIYQVQKWNERKNGNDSPYNFVCRYSGETDPDNDFIDLDALVGNIARSCIEDDRRQWEEHLQSTKWSFRRWRWNLLAKFGIGCPSKPQVAQSFV